MQLSPSHPAISRVCMSTQCMMPKLCSWCLQVCIWLSSRCHRQCGLHRGRGSAVSRGPQHRAILGRQQKPAAYPRHAGVRGHHSHLRVCKQKAPCSGRSERVMDVAGLLWCAGTLLGSGMAAKRPTCTKACHPLTSSRCAGLSLLQIFMHALTSQSCRKA